MNLNVIQNYNKQSPQFANAYILLLKDKLMQHGRKDAL